MALEFFIFILIFASIALCLLGIYLLAQYRRNRGEFKKRLQEIEETSEEERTDVAIDKTYFFRLLASIGNFLKPKKDENVSALKRIFLKAGYRKESAISLFFGAKVFIALSFLAGALALKSPFWEAMPRSNLILFSVIAILAGFYTPNLWVRWRTKERRDIIQRGIPDGLDLMVVCVEAGVGLDAAFNKVAEEMKKANAPLSEELRMVNLEIRAGKSRLEALKNLTWRTDVEDLSNLVTLLVQTEKFGTSIGQALRVHSEAMRTKRYQRAEEMAQKLPIKMIFPLVLFIFPMFFLVTMGPAMFVIMKYFGK